MNQLQQLKEAAREKFTAENNNNLWTTATEQIEEINPLLDEIITSTYLQAERDFAEFVIGLDQEHLYNTSGTDMDLVDRDKILQSLKQTKE